MRVNESWGETEGSTEELCTQEFCPQGAGARYKAGPVGWFSGPLRPTANIQPPVAQTVSLRGGGCLLDSMWSLILRS